MYSTYSTHVVIKKQTWDLYGLILTVVDKGEALDQCENLHEPVGQVQFVVFEKIYKGLFIPNCTQNHEVMY